MKLYKNGAVAVLVLNGWLIVGRVEERCHAA